MFALMEGRNTCSEMRKLRSCVLMPNTVRVEFKSTFYSFGKGALQVAIYTKGHKVHFHLTSFNSWNNSSSGHL